MESWLLALQADMLAVNAEIQGMIAQNQYCISRAETLAYDEYAFQLKADELKSISQHIIHYR